jgi:hypothetical protein
MLSITGKWGKLGGKRDKQIGWNSKEGRIAAFKKKPNAFKVIICVRMSIFP